MPSAGQPFTREDLVSLKRADIQKLCKDYGVRANMKTDALIELLLDSYNSNMSPLVGPSRPQQAPQAPVPRRASTRSSTRVSSLRSRGTSGSSSSTSFIASSTHTTSSPRTTKSKITQYRLGVGRPSMAGGSGLRNTSRSTGGSNLKGRRSSRSLRPPEATIDEEPETSQPAIVTEERPVPSSSREPQWTNGSSNNSNDMATRLARLETLVRESDVKRQLDSLREIPSQVAYLKASVQQREAEITGLRGELNVCKSEVLALRGEISKIPFLEDQLRSMREYLEHVREMSSSAVAKGKMTRRVSTPFGDNNVNTAAGKTSEAPIAPQETNAGENPIPSSHTHPGPSNLVLGKRLREANSNGSLGLAREGNAMTQEELARHMIHPENRKRGRMLAERRPLQEKGIEPKRDTERPSPDHESGDEHVGSAGSSGSGPSTQPSVGTPPPPAQVPEFLSEFDLQHGELRSDELDMMDFCQAASSTPRDDIFNFLDDGETFSPISASKLTARMGTGEGVHNGGTPHPMSFGQRRISTAVARPRTPTRPSGHARFRVAVDTVSPIRDDVATPFDPYGDAAGFGLPFGQGLESAANFARRADVRLQPQNQGLMPAPMPLVMNFGGVMPVGEDSSPVQQAPRTMYGTELQNDTRFGDFGRDGIATSSNMNFWGNY